MFFDTTGGIDPATGPFEVQRAVLFITLINSSTFDPNDGVIYDPTYDPIDTYPPLGQSVDGEAFIAGPVGFVPDG